MRESPRKPGPYHHGDLRQALLAAALAEVEASGPETVSLAALARALGVSQAAPYRHFPDRDALLTAVAAEGFLAFRKALLEAAPARPGGRALAPMCRAYVGFGLARPGLYRLMFGGQVLKCAPPDAEVSTLALGSFDLLVEAVAAAGGGDSRRQALKIWVGLHGAVLLAAAELLGGGLAPVTLDELVDDIAAG